MRTKTLLLTAALSAVGLSTSMAQVYSVNAVGFVNVTIPAKSYLIVANPLDAGAGNNTVGKLFKSVPEGFIVYKYVSGSYTINAYELGEFAQPNQALEPGEGAFVLNPSTTAALTITFVGEVKQGALTQDIPKGLSIQASKVPQAGVLDKDLGFPVVEGDIVYRFGRTNTGGNPAGYSVHGYELGEWGVVPNIEVAEGFFVNKAAAVAWNRNFNVNQ